MKRWAMMLVLIVLLAACGTPGQVGRSPSPQRTAFEPAPLGLVNMWRVSNAEGEKPETWLRIDVAEMQLWREKCGPIFASWRATESLLLAEVNGSTGECGGSSIPKVPWLDAVQGYRSSPGGWELTDGAGAVLATLRVDGTPEPNEQVIEEYTQPPEITDGTRKALRIPDPIPVDATPITVDQLQGRWIPSGEKVATDPHLRFSAAGRYDGSDGCNGAGGRWALATDGSLLATTGASTQIGCEGAPVQSWMQEVRSAALDDKELILYDAGAMEIARMIRG